MLIRSLAESINRGKAACIKSPETAERLRQAVVEGRVAALADLVATGDLGTASARRLRPHGPRQDRPSSPCYSPVLSGRGCPLPFDLAGGGDSALTSN